MIITKTLCDKCGVEIGTEKQKIWNITISFLKDEYHDLDLCSDHFKELKNYFKNYIKIKGK